MTLNQKLATIQTKFKSKKSRFNSFGKYYFRSAEDILEATKPYLLELGVSVKIDETLIETSPVPIIESRASLSDGENTLNATALVGVDLNQKGMQTPQQFGTASSYGKKYALGNLFLIDDTQDADATNGLTMNKAAIDKAKSFVQAGGKLEAIKKKYNVTPDIEKQLTTL
jgi:ERF superfamily.